MIKFKTWVSAARLRTLPLSVSGILVGTGIAAQAGYFSLAVFSLALTTTLGLQILSNFANDYGDFVKGTDNEDRVGPQRALQSGLITQAEMYYGMVITACATALFALMLIFVAFGWENLLYIILFTLLGAAAIAAAIKYTIGERAYGYRGLGDVFVFLFFGIVGVYGCYFLYALDWDWRVLLPASAIGVLSAGVLNLNNMRDRISDKKAGKHTLVVKLGPGRAKHYHYLLVLSAIFFMVIYTALTYQAWDDILYWIAFVPLLRHLKVVMGNRDPEVLDPELKVLAISTFLMAVLFTLGQII